MKSNNPVVQKLIDASESLAESRTRGPMRNRYTFSGHTDYSRRFCSSAEYVGDNSAGRAVFAWKDGLWTVDQRAGRSTYYVATRVSVTAIVHKVDTRAAREALGGVIEALETRFAGVRK